MKVVCRCQFDITATGVRHHFNAARLPFTDDTGQQITDEATWYRARNQQRNWETLSAVISLRALPMDIAMPKMIDHNGSRCWQFDFSVEQPGVFEIADNPVGILIQDCHGVPMHTGLDEQPDLQPCMIAQGSDINTWFTVLPD